MKPVNEIEARLFATIARLEMAKALMLPTGKLMHPGFPDRNKWQQHFMDLALAQAELNLAAGNLEALMRDFSEVIKTEEPQ